MHGFVPRGGVSIFSRIDATSIEFMRNFLRAVVLQKRYELKKKELAECW